MSNNIEELIPHRAPFLFVDEILSYSAEEITGVTTFAKDTFINGSFAGLNFVPGSVVLESMAQCGGAGVKLLNITNGLFALASIESAEFLAVVEYEKQVKYKIKNIRLSEKIIKQSGIAYVDDQPVMEATWMCVRMG